MKLTAQDIEIAVAKHFGTRQNLIVPNVSWGLASPSCQSLFSGFTMARGQNGIFQYRDQRVFNTRLDMGGFY